MSTLTTIQSSDLITTSRADINNNFTALNTDKIETNTLDTDTALAANSDAKIPSQKAVKAYVDAGGNVNATETVKGIVEEATDAEITAGTATGGTGAKLFVTPAKLATLLTSNDAHTFNTFEDINGSVTPSPVMLLSSNSILKADANVAHRQSFLGFVKTNIASTLPSVLGSAVNSTATNQSFTADIGTDRVILIFASSGDNSSSAALPTAFTWNGLSFTSVTSITSNVNLHMQVWSLAIGTSVSSQTFDVIKTGGSGANGVIHQIVCFDKVDQTTPASATGSSVNAAGDASGSVTFVQLYGKLVISARSRLGTANISAPSGVTDLIVGGSQELSQITHDGTAVTITGGSGSGDNVIIGISLKGVPATALVYFQGVVSGFTGLTIGSKYYVSDTVGTIQTTAGTLSLPVGIAISATEILIRYV